MLTFRAQPRFAKVLDSIANLSVADPQHEVIAVALNITSCSTNLYMASNHGVPPRTVRHINKLWSLLQDISKDYADHNRDDAQPDSKSPIQPHTSSLPFPAQKRIIKFHRESLKFCSNKLNRRIDKHYSAFLAIESPEISDFQKTIECLATLMKCRDILDDEDWELAWDGLSNLQVETTKMFREKPDLYESFETTFPAKRYLEKVVSFAKDIKILLNAANSPRLRPYFRNRFSIQSLDPISSTTGLPSTIKEWENVALKALQEANRRKAEELEYEALPSKIRADGQKLVKSRSPTPRNFVHCECVILSYMAFHPEEVFISYVGISKLCCRGCSYAITAVNLVKGTGICTKGCHHKWYYPWKFPPLPKVIEGTAVNHMYGEVADFFGDNYAGFRPKTQQTLSDSDCNSLADDQHSDFEGSGAKNLPRFYKNPRFMKK